MDGGGGNRAEAERWLYTANKLLSARDLHGAQSFAIRARESDPTFDASELLLTVIDTLLAGETRINDQHRDWYGILQILRYSTNIDHIAAQYHRLALLLDPHRNPFAFAAHAFSLIHDAWSVLSNPAKKAMYDADLRLLTSTPPPAPAATQQQPHHHQHHQHNPLTQAQPQSTPRRNPRSKDAASGASDPNVQNRTAAESARQTRTAVAAASNDAAATESSFWTSCPYCYVLYEYPRVYEECTLRCQSCRRGFQAVVIRSPPLNGKDSSFCSWGFFPLGFSQDSKDINGFSSNWNPFSPLFPCPLKGSNRRKASWTYYDDEAAAAFVELSDPSEDDSDDGDWRTGSKKARKKTRVSPRDPGSSARKAGRPRKVIPGSAQHQNVGGGAVDGGGGGGGAAGASGGRPESSKKVALGGSRRRGGGNLDLNVEFSNDPEEPSRRVGVREGNAAGNAEDNMEGIGFFEGLDEFLSSLPILNVVADDKAKVLIL
ncbi:hypothetical protein AAHE18_03G252100 [Arachis hypogaea]